MITHTEPPPHAALMGMLMPHADLFELLVGSVVDYAIFMVSPAGLVLSWNAGAERLKGYKADEIIGQHVRTFYAPADADLAEKLLSDARALGRTEAEGWRVRKDGSRFWANVVMTALPGPDGVRGFAKITRDLTERREAELARQALLDAQTALLDGSPEESLSVDVSSRVLAVHPPSPRGLRAIYGVDIAVDDDLRRSLEPIRLADWDACHEKVMRGEALEYEVSVVVGGRRSFYLVARSPIFAGSHVVGETVSSRDITRTRETMLRSAVLEEVMRVAGRPDTTVDALCEDTLNRFCRHLGWSCGHVLRPTGAGDGLVSTKIWFAETAGAHDEFRRVSEAMTFGPGVGLPGTALLTKDVVFIPDVAVAANFPRNAILVGLGLHAAIAFPVLVEDEVVAVLELFSTRYIIDPEPLVDLARLIASQLARAVERERASATLSVAESRLRRLFDSAPAGMALLDEDERIVAANDALALIVGHSKEALCQRGLADLVPAADRDLARPSLRHAEVPGPLEHVPRLVHADGRVLDVDVRIAALQADSTGGRAGKVLHVLDITRRVRGEAELRRSNAELEQFAYAASHDLRAPLRAVRSLAGILEEDLAGTLGPESTQHLALLRARVERMETLLGALLEFARAGRAAEQKRVIDVHRLVDDAIALAAVREGFQVENRCAKLEVETAPIALERVFLNLIVNALKHHDRSTGRVTIDVRDAGRYLAFDVVDDGPGIASAYQERVFQMFQTLRSRDEVEGSGMGLTLVRKIVDQAGGRIGLTSEGRGCRFSFTWPKAWPESLVAR